jgi:hypothetical protein
MKTSTWMTGCAVPLASATLPSNEVGVAMGQRIGQWALQRSAAAEQ